MKFNINKFKKIKSDKASTTLIHPDGHEITIAHEHLSPKIKADLHAMPLHGEAQQMAEGGGVAADPEFQKRVAQEENTMAVNSGMPGTSMNPLDKPTAPVDMDQFKNEAETKAAKDMIAEKQILGADSAQQYTEQKAQVEKDNAVRAQAGLPPLDPPAPPPNMQMPAAAPAQPMATNLEANRIQSQDLSKQPTGPNDPYGVEAYYGALSKGIGQEKQGLQQQYLAESQTGKAQAADLQKAVDQQKSMNDLYTQHVNDLSKERAGFLKDYQDQHIDPNRIWSNMGTGGKIATTVGLIVGGFGAGLTGQENLGMKVLNNEIERDIEAQKMEQGKKWNLLQANREQFQNEHDAMAMTRINLNDLVSNQMKQAAANTSDMMAKARLNQASGQIDQKNAALFSQLAMRRTILGGAQQGLMDPSQAVRVIVPEHQQAAAYKELGEAQQMSKARDNILGAFNQLEKINTIGHAVTSPIQTSKQVSAIKDPLVAQLSKETAGRFTEQDAKFLDSLFPAKGDDAKTILTKRQQVQKLVGEKMNFPLLKSFGIDPTRAARFGASGQSKIQESAPVK